MSTNPNRLKREVGHSLLCSSHSGLWIGHQLVRANHLHICDANEAQHMGDIIRREVDL